MNSKDFWEERYIGGDSGYGSYGSQANLKLKLLRENIPSEEIKSIVDIGCGDFYFGSRMAGLFPNASYVGIDQAKIIVDRNISIFNSRFKFIVGEDIKDQADLILCIDVLLHVLDKDQERELLLNLKDKWKKYLVISAFDHDGEPEPNGQAVMRKLDESMFGNPIVKELLEQEGCNLYIWKK